MASNYSNLQFNQPQQNQFSQQNSQNLVSPMMTMQNNLYSTQQFFPQPQGSVYMINNSSEINNIPISGNLSAIVCLNEGILYLKTLQNGTPMMLSYKLNSIENQSSSEVKEEDVTNKKITDFLKNYDERLNKIEDALIKTKEKNGGKLDWAL